MSGTRLASGSSSQIPAGTNLARSQPHSVTMALQLRLALFEWSLTAIVVFIYWYITATGSFGWLWSGVVASAMVLAIQLLNGYGLDRLLRPRLAAKPAVLGLILLFASLMCLPARAELWPGGWPDNTILVGSLFMSLGTVMTACSVRMIYAAWIHRRAEEGTLRRQIGVITCGSGKVELAKIEKRLNDETSLPPTLRNFSFASADSITEASRRADILSKQISDADLDEVVLAIEGTARVEDVACDPKLAELLKALEMLPHRTRLILPDGLGGMRIARLVNPPLDHGGLLLKRCLDIAVSSTLLVLLAPLLVTVAIAVKIDSPGPVFFRQKRFGFRNTIFELWKFRSMRTELCDADATKLTSRDDPRVTRVGALIRRSSVDELPQLLNVLKGDMSLVGPRPHPISAKAGSRLYEDVVDRFARRYRVKPGLTGLAQVSGLRGNTDTEDKLVRRFEADLDYVRNWSIWRDLVILLKTPWASISGENAF